MVITIDGKKMCVERAVGAKLVCRCDGADGKHVRLVGEFDVDDRREFWMVFREIDPVTYLILESIGATLDS